MRFARLLAFFIVYHPNRVVLCTAVPVIDLPSPVLLSTTSLLLNMQLISMRVMYCDALFYFATSLLCTIENTRWNLGTHEPYNLLAPKSYFQLCKNSEQIILHVEEECMYMCAIFHNQNRKYVA
jgi:hypothetical protein